MPSVVRRWHGEPFQKLLRERKIALATACGAFEPSSVATMSQHVVLSVSFQFFPSATLFEGTLFHDAGVAGGFTVGAGHGFAAFEAPADADGDGKAAEVGVVVAAGDAVVVLELVRRSRAAPMAMPRTTMTVRPIAIALRCARRRATTRSCCLDAHFSYRRLAYSRSRLLGDTCPPRSRSPGVRRAA